MPSGVTYRCNTWLVGLLLQEKQEDLQLDAGRSGVSPKLLFLCQSRRLLHCEHSS